MNSKERFYATVNYKTPDRPPVTPLEGQNRVWEKLYDYFGIHYEKDGFQGPRYHGLSIAGHEEFQSKIEEDFRSIQPRYAGPWLNTFDDGSWEGMWGERYEWVSFSGGEYVESIYQPFKNIESVEELKGMQFPSPDWYDYSHVRADCEKYPEYALYTGDPGHGDFINGIAFARGVEQVLLDIGMEDPVYLYLMEKRYQFFHEVLKRTLEAADGRIDVVRFGEDLGTQLGPMISPAKFDRLFAPKYKSLFDMVHSYGAKTMMHSCGSIKVFLNKLIETGLDIIDVVQVDAVDMNIEQLHKEFYKKIVFSGSISVQSILANGSAEDIAREVELRKKLFAEGGIIIGPTNVMQIDMPVENFVAMCKAIGCLKGNWEY